MTEPTLPPRFPPELLTPAEMAEADRLAAASMPSATLMEYAGAAVAALVRELAADGDRILVLCGPGNNGGDGFVAARRLAEAGLDVEVALFGPRDALRGDAAAAAARWTGRVSPLADATSRDATWNDAAIVVDALFGAGLARDLADAPADAVRRANDWRARTGRPLVAVDVPSGIDGATGLARGRAIEASHTITFFRLKPGHALLPGRLRCGVLRLADIGLPDAVLGEVAPRGELNVPAAWIAHLPEPSLAGHKYARGHALVVSGPIDRTGAARLCARGALRAGAGLVTVATTREALPVLAAALTGIMTRVADDTEGFAAVLADPRKNAVVMGPGLGTGAGTRALVLAALAPRRDVQAPPRAVVLDADALTSFADEPATLFEAIAAGGHAVVLTPHDGEFAKLFSAVLDVEAPKPRRVRDAAAASGAIVMLKGPDTTIARPDGRVSIAMSEAPWLATAGSGDVLAGMIGGFLAQAMPTFEAACAAVWMHAEAARRFGPGLVSEDIPEGLPAVLRDLFAQRRATVSGQRDTMTAS